jgi:hypothetical protein
VWVFHCIGFDEGPCPVNDNEGRMMRFVEVCYLDILAIVTQTYWMRWMGLFKEVSEIGYSHLIENKGELLLVEN